MPKGKRRVHYKKREEKAEFFKKKDKRRKLTGEKKRKLDCKIKRKFTTIADAQAAIEKQSSLTRFNFYYCEYCGGHHLYNEKKS